MSIDIRLPNITGNTEAAQLAQIKSYLYQMVGQLNYALSTIESGTGVVDASGKSVSVSSSVSSQQKEDPVSSFNSIKALIIKSADIITAYYEVIGAKLAGDFVAQSEFGTFVEQTTQELEASSTAIEQFYANLQEIITDIENVEHTLIEVNAHIKSGLLYYDEEGAPVYGLEIGQRTEIEGAEVFNKYARFTSEKLSFYDNNDNEVAYISDKKLYINHVEVTGSFTLGGFVDTVQSDGSVVTRWIEGGA